MNSAGVHAPMGVLEDIKKSFGDDESSGDATFGQTGSGDDLNSDFRSGGQDSGGIDNSGLGGNPSEQENNQNSLLGGQDNSQDLNGPDAPQRNPSQGQNPSQNPSQGQNSGQQGSGQRGSRSSRRQRGSSQSSTPNAQAGRPQEGGSSPQLSQDTRRKMENAGISDSGSQAREQPPQDDIEELKQQNQEIIGLLEEIVDELQGGRRR